VVLQPRLREIIQAPFVRKAGALLLEPLVAQVTGPEALQDRTGYEAFINKVHVDDLVDDVGTTNRDRLHVLVQQGAKGAIELSERLTAVQERADPDADPA
jgi:hypothetical protein